MNDPDKLLAEMGNRFAASTFLYPQKKELPAAAPLYLIRAVKVIFRTLYPHEPVMQPPNVSPQLLFHDLCDSVQLVLSRLTSHSAPQV